MPGGRLTLNPLAQDPVTDPEDRALVLRAKSGDAAALEELLERHLPELRRYVRKRISPALLEKESSSDVVQSVCREVLQGVDNFEYQGEVAFRSWLHRTALRKLVHHQRYHEAQKRDASEVEVSTLSAAEFARFEAFIASIPEIVEAVQVSGEFDYLAKVVVPDVRAWRELAARLQEGEHGVEKVISHIVLKDSKSFSGYPLKLP